MYRVCPEERKKANVLELPSVLFMLLRDVKANNRGKGRGNNCQDLFTPILTSSIIDKSL